MKNVGYASLQIVPTMKGARATLAAELNASVGEAMSKAAPGAAKHGSKLGSKFAGGFGTAFKAAGAVAGTAILAGTGAITAFGAKAISAGVAFNALGQRSRAALTTLLGSSKKANAQMDKLDEFAKTSPFAKEAFINAQQQLIGFGFAAKDVLPTLNSIQDAVAATGGSSESIGEIANILATVKSTGKITADTLNQLGYRGIDAAKLIGGSLGKSGEQIRESIHKGALDSDKAITALTRGMARKFGGAAKNVKKTWAGATDRVKGATRNLGSALVEPFISKKGGGYAVTWANQIADTIYLVLPKVQKWSKKMSKTIGPMVTKALKAIQKLAKGFDGKGLDKLLGQFEKFAPVLAPLAGLLAGKTSGFLGDLPLVGKFLPGLSGPLGLIATLVGTMVADSPELQGALGGALKALGDTLTELAPSFEAIMPSISTAMATLADNFADVVIELTPFIPMIGDLLKTLLDLAGPLLENQTLVTGLATAFIGVKGAQKGLEIGKQIQEGANALQRGADATKDFGKKTGAGLKKGASSVATGAKATASFGAKLGRGVAKGASLMADGAKATAGFGAKVAKGIGKGVSAVAGGTAKVAKFGGAFAKDVVQGVGKAAGALGKLTGKIALNTGAWLANKGALVASKLAIMAQVIWGGILKAATVIWTGVQWLLNAALAANPLVWIVLAIIAVIAVIVLLATKTKFFQTVWKAVWGGIKIAWAATVKFFTGIGETIGRALSKVWDKVKKVWGAATSAIKKSAEKAWNGIVGFVKKVPGWLWSAFQNFTLPGLLIKHWRSIKDAAVKAWNALVGVVKAIPGRIASAMGGLVARISRIWTRIRTKAGEAWTALREMVSRRIESLVRFVGGLPRKITDALSNMASALAGVGADVVTGLINGIRNNAGRLASAVKTYIMDALPGPVRKFLESKSPSKVFVRIGRDIMRGLAKGIADNSEDVIKALQLVSATIVKAGTDAVKAEASRLIEARRKANARIAKWNRSHKGTKHDRDSLGALSSTEAQKKARENLKSVLSAAKAAAKLVAAQAVTTKKIWQDGTRAGTAALLKALTSRGKWTAKAGQTLRKATLADVGKAREYLATRIDTARDALGEMQDAFSSLRDQVASSLAGETDLGSLVSDEASAVAPKFANVSAYVKATAARIRVFAGKLKALAAQGIPPGLIQEVANLGSTTGVPIANALLSGSKAEVKSLAADWASIDAWSTSAGNVVAHSMYDVGLAARQGIVDGLLADDGKLKKAAERIADTLTKAVKKKLGIKSPSTVFADIGAQTMSGFALGIERNASQVADAFGVVAASVGSAASGALVPGSVGYRPAGASVVPQQRQNVYVQNPFTGEYLLTTMSEVADVRSTAAVLSASRARTSGMRAGQR